MSWLKVRDRGAYLKLTGVLALVFMSAGSISPVLANYVKSLGAGTGEIGLVFAVYQASSLGSQYWWGMRSDRMGRRKPLVLIGTAGLAVSYLAIAGANWYGWLFVIRALEGLAFAAYSTGSLALIGDVLEDEADRGRLIGMYRMFGSLAFSVAALSGGWLADTVGLRGPVVLAAVCYALAFLLVKSLRERTTRASEADAPAETQADGAGGEAGESQPAGLLPDNPLARRVFWPFLGLSFAWTFGMGSVVSLWPVYMDGIGYSQTAIGGLWALAALGEVPCLMLAGYLADRWGRKWVILTGVALMSCVFTAYTLTTALAWFIPIQMVRSFAYSCFEAPALLYATELGLRRQRGRLAGLYHSASGLGGITGSALGGAAAQQFGLPAMYRGVTLVMLAVALVVARVMPRLRRAAPAPVEQPAPAAPDA